MKKNIFTYSIVAGLLIFFGCSKTKNESAPTQVSVSVHGEGFADSTSSNFHANYIRAHSYNLQLCKQCHGIDYSGGTAGQSCLSCHNKSEGPENCTTCHGNVNAAPPKDLSGNTSRTARGVGAHQIHLTGSSLSSPIACTQCHVVPTQMSSPGHIDGTNGAEVRFDTTSVFYRANATYSNGSCANTYCHGNFNNGNSLTMSWTDTSSTAAACGTCHGDVTKTTLEEKAFPKSGHPSTDSKHCSTCHRAVVDASMNIINPSRHINGKVD
jgi:predicted CxxxxCH...CXXCH cytochrome family protein